MQSRAEQQSHGVVVGYSRRDRKDSACKGAPCRLRSRRIVAPLAGVRDGISNSGSDRDGGLRFSGGGRMISLAGCLELRRMRRVM